MRRGSSRKCARRGRRAAAVAVALLLLLLAACGTEGAGDAAGGQSPAGSTSAGSSAGLPREGFFLVDTLVRSRRLPGIDLHLRYAHRRAGALVLHLAFYNNGPDDLLAVEGVDIGAARLRGSSVEAPVGRSTSFETGIAPAETWYAGGATNGTLTFAPAAGDGWTFELPGFPAVAFRLDTPLREAPEPPPAEPGSYTYDFEAPGDRRAGSALRIERVTLTGDTLELIATFVRDGPGDVPVLAEAGATGAVLFDARWNQYRPSEVGEPPGTTGQTNGLSAEGSSALFRFPRPVAGDVMLLRFPSFPAIRIPLHPNGVPSLATAADLPPSAEPRPAETPAAPTERGTGESAWDAVDALLASVGDALQAGDRAAYLEAFVPEARADQGVLFDQIRALPLEGVTFVGNSTREGALDGDELRGYRATWTYRVQDVDPANSFSTRVELDFRRDAGRWRIARIGGDVPFWAFGATEAERAGAFWIFYRPAARSQLAAIKDEVMAAMETINRALPGRARPANVMFVTETAPEFAALTGRDPARFLGIALSRWEAGASGIRVTEAAFYINGAAFRDDPGQNWRRTITHELTHLALAPRTMPFTPVWLVEGMAMQVAEDLPAAGMRAALASQEASSSFDLEAFTEKRAFGELDQTGEQTALDYAYAAYLARYLTATYGFDRFLAFYDSFADVPVEAIHADLSAPDHPAASATMGTLARKLTPGRLWEAFGIDLATLERDFQTWLQTQAGE